MHKKLKKRKEKQRCKETNKIEYKKETSNISGFGQTDYGMQFYVLSDITCQIFSVSE